MTPLPPSSTPTDTLVPYTALFRSLGAARAARHVAEIGLGRVGFGAARAALHVGEIGLLVATAGCQRQRIGIVGVLGVAHRGLLCRVCGRQRPTATVKKISSRAKACRKEEQTTELQSHMRSSYHAFCFKNKKKK